MTEKSSQGSSGEHGRDPENKAQQHSKRAPGLSNPKAPGFLWKMIACDKRKPLWLAAISSNTVAWEQKRKFKIKHGFKEKLNP